MHCLSNASVPDELKKQCLNTQAYVSGKKVSVCFHTNRSKEEKGKEDRARLKGLILKKRKKKIDQLKKLGMKVEGSLQRPAKWGHSRGRRSCLFIKLTETGLEARPIWEKNWEAERHRYSC